MTVLASASLSFANLLRAALALGLLITTAPAGRAWSDLGHRVVATIALDHLTSATRAVVDRLAALPVQPKGRQDRGEGFVALAGWADDVRLSARTGAWHYVDLPIAEPGIPTRPPKASNAVTAMARQERVLHDPASSDAAKTVALRYVVHLMGDLHQPLHCASRYSPAHPTGDAGGNAFKIRGSKTGARNLHALWDQGCGVLAREDETRDAWAAVAGAPGRDRVRRLADRLEKLHPNAPKRPRFSDFSALAAESNKAAQAAYASIEEGATPSPAYLRKGREASERRLALAGLRLAALLNSIFDPAEAAPQAKPAAKTRQGAVPVIPNNALASPRRD